MAGPLDSGELRAADLGGYAIESKLGQGGMGAVYLARHPSVPGKAFALKVLSGDELDADAVARFKREMQALAAVSGHPGIVKIHGGRVEGRLPYFVMELVSGQSLSKLIAKSPLEPRRAASVVRHVADAIAHAHAQGVLHRDLKPENVMVEADGRPRVCDFGLATLAGQERLTQSTASLGTAAFSAPEQLDGRARDADARADVYALGGILFASLAGRPPFEGSGVQLLKRVLMDPASPPSKVVATTPAVLDLICEKALEKEPADRYQTVAAFRDDLDHFLAGEPVSVKPLTRAEHFARWRKRHRRRFAGGVGLAAAALAVSVVIPTWWRTRAVAAAERPDAPIEVVEHALDVARGDKELYKRARDRLVPALVSRLKDRPLADDAFQDRLQLLARHDPTEDELDAVWTAQLAALEQKVVPQDKTRALPRAQVLTLLAFAQKRPRACLDLVGEKGSPLALGDALVEAACLDEAAAVVSAALALAPDDPAARFLRARVRLAHDGAPSRPLGSGRLDRAALRDRGTLDDLGAAEAGLKGEPRARASWLTAELLAAAASPGLADALARSRAHHLLDAALEEKLLEALELKLTEESYATLAGHLRKGDSYALRALALFLARAGLPAALEDPTRAEFVVRNERADPRRVAVEESDPRVYRPTLGGSVGAPTQAALPADFDALPLERKLRLRPRDALLLSYAAASAQGPRGVLAPIFRVLCARENLHEIAQLASDGTSGGLAGIASAEGALGDMKEAAAGDPCIDALRASLAPGTIDDALSAVVGIRRISELDTLSLRHDQEPETRDRLVFRAFLELGALERLGGPTVLPFRARLRRHAFPGRLGTWLALVDFERMTWLATNAAELGLDPFRTLTEGHDRVDFATWLFLGALEAWCPTAPETEAEPELAKTASALLGLGSEWLREEDLVLADFDPTFPFDRLLSTRVESVARWGFALRANERTDKLRKDARGQSSVLLDPDRIRERAKLEKIKGRTKREEYRFVAPEPPDR